MNTTDSPDQELTQTDPAAAAAGGSIAPDLHGLHSDTADLVATFAAALALKLRAAEAKYGYSNNWKANDWRRECQRELLRHVRKGDPLDVAAYAAFCWAHQWPTSDQKRSILRSPRPLEIAGAALAVIGLGLAPFAVSSVHISPVWPLISAATFLAGAALYVFAPKR